ncbi:MAG: MFS transporter [FCB group bacterium]|nr:MFS transporter [FCB group bacterium]
MKKSLHLLRNPTFARFFAGNAISLIGWGFNFIAVGWIVLDITGSKLAVGEMVAVSTLPGLIIALGAGTLIDRVNRKHVLVTIDIFRGISVAAIPILYWLGYFHLWQLYIMSFLIGTGSAIFWSTAAAFTQELVSEKDFMTANSLLSASYQSGALLGSALGGFVVHAWGGQTALALDALSYFISATLIGTARHRSHILNGATESVWTMFMGGLRFVHEKKLVFFYGITAVIADVAIWGSLAVLTLALSTDILNMGARGFGLLDGAYGIGALLSTAIALGVVRHLKRRNFLLGAYAIAAVMCGLLPLASNLAAAMILFFFMGLPNNSARIITRTILMEHIPNHIMGRAQTILGVVTRALIIISTLWAGWLTERFSVRIALEVTSFFFWTSFLGVFITGRIQPEFFNGLHLEDQSRT